MVVDPGRAPPLGFGIEKCPVCGNLLYPGIESKRLGSVLAFSSESNDNIIGESQASDSEESYVCSSGNFSSHESDYYREDEAEAINACNRTETFPGGPDANIPTESEANLV